MADVTGRVYEAFTEFCLRRLGYRDEWTEGKGRQYLYEKHREALCHSLPGICAHREACHSFSKKHNLPFGPWYDPDFLVLEDGRPVACLHVTHWSNPRDSKRKFWRTIEDHFQYKTSFGPDFLSVNLVYVALPWGRAPELYYETAEKVRLHGWDPAIGSVLLSAFDVSIAFPLKYPPLEQFARQLPPGSHGGPKKRRQLYNGLWEELYRGSVEARSAVDHTVGLLDEAMSADPRRLYPEPTIASLQEVCFAGRRRAAPVHETASRYRKGLQHAFLLRELIARRFGEQVDPDGALWRLLDASPRFPWAQLPALLGLPGDTGAEEVAGFRDLLGSIPVKMDKRIPVPLLVRNAGMEHAAWNADLAQFILGLKHLPQDDRSALRAAMAELFETYRAATGMDYVLADLAQPQRIAEKIRYVYDKYVGIGEKDRFISRVAADMLTPGQGAPHQETVKDSHNWVLDGLLTAYSLGSVQEINNRIFELFEQRTGESLRHYAYQGNYLVGYLLVGVDTEPNFSREASLSRDTFYQAIWPFIAECVWEAILGRKPLDRSTAEFNYRYKKAMRIISSPDLEPISFLFRRSLPQMVDGPTLRGAFNQLSTMRGWSRAALTTDTAGRDPLSGAIIQTQAVIGGNGGQIGHKTRELAARLRSVHLRCRPDGVFEPEPDPGEHYLVVDGDWPVESKINLLEAGFQGIFEIAELDKLSEELATRAKKP